ncbi:MAG: glucose 1-dehydrogenase [Nocardioides sp.]|uniref:SDR family NAD(P)-dependent oxidoreductase n=1 Tax=Nocardioides sp. TaxID=35761 RepID=UPI0039E64C85
MAGGLAGRAAIVTGGGGGLGRASALALVHAGAAVAVVDLRPESADRVAEEISDLGGRAIALSGDISDEATVESLVARTAEEFGRIDVLHNNAALMDPDLADLTVLEFDPAVFHRVLSVNVVGYALTAKHAIPQMIAGGGGVVVNTASIAGHAAELDRMMYGTSKAAIHGLTRNIAIQHGRDGIRCVSISPGVIATAALRDHLSAEEIDQFASHTALGRLGTPEEVGAVVAFLASDAAANITGTDLVIDGGTLTQFPTVGGQHRRASGGGHDD